MKKNYSTNEILKIANKFEHLSKSYSIKKYAHPAIAVALFVIPLLGTTIREAVMSAESLEEAANNVLEAIQDLDDTCNKSSLEAYGPSLIQSVMIPGSALSQAYLNYNVREKYKVDFEL